MEETKRKALEAAGWKFATVQEFLGLSDAEMKMAVARGKLASEIQRRRKACKLSQPAFAKVLKTSQPRISLMESANPGVSIDQMFTAMLATGATLKDIGEVIGAGEGPNVDAPMTKDARRAKQTSAGSLAKKAAAKKASPKRPATSRARQVGN